MGVRIELPSKQKVSPTVDVQMEARVKIAYYHTGIAYARLGKYERALWPLTRCIEINQSDTRFLMERGKAFQVLEQFPQAIADFNRVIQLDHKHAHAYFRRAFAFKATKRFHEAAEDFEMAKKLEPLNALMVVNYRGLKDVNFV